MADLHIKEQLLRYSTAGLLGKVTANLTVLIWIMPFWLAFWVNLIQKYGYHWTIRLKELLSLCGGMILHHLRKTSVSPI